MERKVSTEAEEAARTTLCLTSAASRGAVARRDGAESDGAARAELSSGAGDALGKGAMRSGTTAKEEEEDAASAEDAEASDDEDDETRDDVVASSDNEEEEDAASTVVGLISGDEDASASDDEDEDSDDDGEDEDTRDDVVASSPASRLDACYEEKARSFRQEKEQTTITRTRCSERSNAASKLKEETDLLDGNSAA